MKKLDYYNFFSLYLKDGGTTYYERMRDVILNRAKDYYETNEKAIKQLVFLF